MRPSDTHSLLEYVRDRGGAKPEILCLSVSKQRMQRFRCADLNKPEGLIDCLRRMNRGDSGVIRPW